MSRALIIVDYQNDFAPPDGALSVPGGEEIAERINALAASGDYDLVLATRDWHPADHGSFARAGRPVAAALRAGHARARRCTRRSTAGRSTRSSTRARTPARRATRASRRPGSRERLRGDGVDARHDRRARHGLLRQEHRARRAAARGSPCGSTRRRCAAWRSSRATPSGPSRSSGPPVRPWRSRPCRHEPGRAPARSAAPARRRPARARRDPRGAARRASSPSTGATRRGTTSRCRSAPGRRSPSRSWSRACASCSSCAATSACSTSAPAPATTPPCSRGSSRTSGASSCTPGWRERAAQQLAAIGAANVTLLVGDGSLGHPAGAPYDAINVAAAMQAIPPALPEQLARGRPARRAARRRRPAARAAAPRARRRAAARGARARALRAAGQPVALAATARGEARVRAVLAPDLRARPPVDQHDVGGEVVGAADQRRADAVGVDGDVRRLEGADALRVEAAGDDDLDVVEAVAVELVADEVDELGVDAVRGGVAVLGLQRAVGQPVGGVEPDAPQRGRRAPRRPRARCARSRSRSRRARSPASCRRSRGRTRAPPPRCRRRRPRSARAAPCRSPRPPHHDAWASVETPIAPATCAAQPSPVCTSQWSWRAGK